MRQIDLTPHLEKRKGARVVYTTMYVNGKYYGFTDNSEMSTGISFVRTTKKGIYNHRNGTPRWYFGNSTQLITAVRSIRKRYGLKVSTSGWQKVRVKAYNFTQAGEIINHLKAVA